MTGCPPPRTVSLSAAPLEVYDVGEGPAVLFFHEWPASAESWRHVVADLAWELVDRLEVASVTVVGSGGGGALAQVFAAQRPDRVRALVVSTGDALEHWPTRRMWPFAMLAWVPPLGWLFQQTLRLRPLVRLVYRLLAVTRIPDDVLDAYTAPVIAGRGVRRDIRRSIRALRGAYSTAAAENLRTFDGPIVIVWGRDDVLCVRDDATRMHEMWPTSRLVQLDGLRILIGEDQPERCAALVRDAVSRGIEARERHGLRLS